MNVIVVSDISKLALKIWKNITAFARRFTKIPPRHQGSRPLIRFLRLLIKVDHFSGITHHYIHNSALEAIPPIIENKAILAPVERDLTTAVIVLRTQIVLANDRSAGSCGQPGLQLTV